ncbi:MAG: hypothetical protein IKU86_01890 [Thermoguttaceae bacterium]|nr:hypothetical protein [Thermoguttaceae bacterium]
MNLKYVGSVTLSLVAVACIALGVGYNASTLGSDGAKVDAAQEPPSPNATAQPETSPAEEAAQEPPSINATAQPETPQIGTAGVVQQNNAEIATNSAARSFGETIGEGVANLALKAIVLLIGIIMSVFWKKIWNLCKRITTSIKKVVSSDSSLQPPFDISQLSYNAVELIVATLLRQAKLQRRALGLYFWSDEGNEEIFNSDFTGEEYVSFTIVLKELGDARLLDFDGEFYVPTEFAQQMKVALIERDNRRLFELKPEPKEWEEIFKEAKSDDAWISFNCDLREINVSVTIHTNHKDIPTTILILLISHYHAEVLQDFLLKSKLLYRDGNDSIYGERFRFTERGKMFWRSYYQMHIFQRFHMTQESKSEDNNIKE